MITFAPGRYYVGDPCYVFEHETWSKICDKLHFDNDIQTVEMPTGTFACIGTMYGDGTYPGSGALLGGKWFDVDAGLVGVVPVSMIDRADGTGFAQCTYIDVEESLLVDGDAGVLTLIADGKRGDIDTDDYEEEEDA